MVAIPVLRPTIRTHPGDAVAGKPPKIFMHTLLAYGKAAAAGPTEGVRGGAAMALAVPGAPAPSAITAFFRSLVGHFSSLPGSGEKCLKNGF